MICTGDQYDPVQGFEFVTAHQAVYPIATMCRVLGVSPSGYSAWRQRPLSLRARTDVKLSAEIQAIHGESRGTYGVPRVHAELAERGIHVGPKRVARLMRGAGLQGVRRRKSFRTTVREETARPAPDLVERQFSAAGPDQLWVADITYLPTWAGFLYLAIVGDAWSRRVVGWAMETHLRTELVLAALDMAVAQRRPTDVIHHSDQGCLGGFDRSSQHRTERGCDDDTNKAFGTGRTSETTLARPALGSAA
jgi:putative transposase